MDVLSWGPLVSTSAPCPLVQGLDSSTADPVAEDRQEAPLP